MQGCLEVVKLDGGSMLLASSAFSLASVPVQHSSRPKLCIRFGRLCDSFTGCVVLRGSEVFPLPVGGYGLPGLVAMPPAWFLLAAVYTGLLKVVCMRGDGMPHWGCNGGCRGRGEQQVWFCKRDTCMLPSRQTQYPLCQ